MCWKSWQRPVLNEEVNSTLRLEVTAIEEIYDSFNHKKEKTGHPFRKKKKELAQFPATKTRDRCQHKHDGREQILSYNVLANKVDPHPPTRRSLMITHHGRGT
jgi:hypothetical protein